MSSTNTQDPVEMEAMAEAVHQAYLDTCAQLGWDVKPANRVPYAALSEDSKELDRASVRAVLASLEASAPSEPEPFAWYVVPNGCAGARFVFEKPMGHPSQRVTPLYTALPSHPIGLEEGERERELLGVIAGDHERAMQRRVNGGVCFCAYCEDFRALAPTTPEQGD